MDKEKNQPRLRQRYLYRRECETCEGDGDEDEGEGITRAGGQRDERSSRRVHSQSQRLPLPVFAAPLPVVPLVLPVPVVLPAEVLAPVPAAELVLVVPVLPVLPVLLVAWPLSVTVNWRGTVRQNDDLDKRMARPLT